jgi:uridine kinase
MTPGAPARWAPQKKDVLAALADEILHNYGRGRTIVAVDGVEPADTSAFTGDLAGAIRLAGHTVFRASIDGFHRSRADRQLRGGDSAEGVYRGAYDYATFRRVLVEPFRMGGSTGFVPASFDVHRDAPVEPQWLTGPADALLLVDGRFLNRPELRGLWNYSVWLEAPREASRTGAGALYWAEAAPRTTATAIIDIADAEHPRRVFADSC